MKFQIHMLPAHHGDCLLIEYGKAAPYHWVLIDGGTDSTWKDLEAALGKIPQAERKLELLVVTHIDADHIGGALKLFDNLPADISFDEVWFNGYRHLKEAEE